MRTKQAPLWQQTALCRWHTGLWPAPTNEIESIVELAPQDVSMALEAATLLMLWRNEKALKERLDGIE
jgi:hypothetical protein